MSLHPLIIIFGPPAVGKMTVGRELSRLIGGFLFHNHLTIEPLLQLFPYGSPSFLRLNRQFRTAIFAEVAASGSGGLVFTYAWHLEKTKDRAEIESYIEAFGKRPDDVYYVELYAPQAIRLARNGTALRLAHKPSKTDRSWSDRNVIDTDLGSVSNTGPDVPFFYPKMHLRIDNTDLAPADVAELIVRHFCL